ncbi:MFS transporter [bacterium]|nr:MFS transporter [bacterium]
MYLTKPKEPINPLAKNIHKYYLYSFLKKLKFSLPIFALYFASKGLNYTNIINVFVAASIAQIIFEVPSGVFADYFGRKSALYVCAISNILSIVFYLFGTNAIHFLCGGFFLGITLAFESGTESAFLYDTLKDLEREKEYKKIEGKAHSFSLIGFAVASFFGGLIALISLQMPFWANFLIALLLPLIIYNFKEPKKYKALSDKKYFVHLKQAAIYSFKHTRIKWLIIFSSLVMVSVLAPFALLQIYIKGIGVPLKFFGIVYTFLLLTSALSSHVAHRVYKRLGEFKALLILPLFAGVALILMGKIIFIFSWVFIILLEFVYGYLKPVIMDEIHKLIESHHRATVLSLKGFVQGALFAILSPFLGYFADIYSLPTVLFIEGILVLIICVPMVFLIVEKKSAIL